MTLGGRDIDAAFLKLLAVDGESRRKRACLGQDRIERRMELTRQMEDSHHRSLKILGDLARQEAQPFKAASGGPYGQYVPVAHPNAPGTPERNPRHDHSFRKQYGPGFSCRRGAISANVALN